MKNSPTESSANLPASYSAALPSEIILAPADSDTVTWHAPPQTTTAAVHCQIFVFHDYTAAPASSRRGNRSIRERAQESEQLEERAERLQEARKWIAEVIKPQEGDTLRTLRLQKGWSQKRLADETETSQPHIARIERGTENLTIQTCRKLAAALDVDMNTLDQMLRRQEAIARTPATV